MGPNPGAPRTIRGVDVGLFGPESVAWRLHADPAMLAGGLRALLVQALDPRAMAGVDQHSQYRVDPWGRLPRTTEFVYLTTYGDRATAEAACAKVRRVHERVQGVDPTTGRAYAASDPELLLWIHAVEVHSFVAAYRAYAGRLDDRDADRYVAEMVQVAERVELPVGMAPRSMGELREYLRSDDARGPGGDADDLLPADAAGGASAVGDPGDRDPCHPAPGGSAALPAAVAGSGSAPGPFQRVRAHPAHERVSAAGADHPAGSRPGGRRGVTGPTPAARGERSAQGDVASGKRPRLTPER